MSVTQIPRSDFVTDSERPWMAFVDEHGITATRDALVSAGLGGALAAGIAVWLRDQLDRRRSIAASTVVKYRRTLDRLGGPIPGYLKRLAA